MSEYARQTATALHRAGVRVASLDKIAALYQERDLSPGRLAAITTSEASALLSAAGSDEDALVAAVDEVNRRRSDAATEARYIIERSRGREAEQLLRADRHAVDRQLAKLLSTARTAVEAAETEMRKAGLPAARIMSGGQLTMNTPADKLRSIAADAGSASLAAFEAWHLATERHKQLLGVAQQCLRTGLLDSAAAIVAEMRSPGAPISGMEQAAEDERARLRGSGTRADAFSEAPDDRRVVDRVKAALGGKS